MSENIVIEIHTNSDKYHTLSKLIVFANNLFCYMVVMIGVMSNNCFWMANISIHNFWQFVCLIAILDFF